MRAIASCLTAVFFQLLFAGTAGPLFALWLEHGSGLAAEYLPWLYDPGRFRTPYWKITSCVCLALLVCGLAYGRLTRSSAGPRRIRPPFLLFPALLMLLWAFALHSTGGDYSAETAAWRLTRLCSQPPFQILWLADLRGLLPEDPAAVPAFLRHIFGTDLLTQYGLFYPAIFEDWQGIGAGLFYQLSFLAGIVLAGAGRRAEAAASRFLTCELTDKGTAVMPSPPRRRGTALLPAAGLLCPAALLCWQIHAIESTLISPRSVWNTENIVRDEAELYLYSPFAAQNLLAVPDRQPSLRIAGNYPRMDGSTAFYPLYAAAFKALYAEPSPVPGGRSRADEKGGDWRTALRCTTTRKAYSGLIRGETDVVFAFEPSAEQRREAEKNGIALRLIPLGREAFVFLVHESNPVGSLTPEQIRDMYTRKKTNWKDFGGPDAAVTAYQRPENSGSQTAMRRFVMRDEKPATPLREELILEMGGIITQVAEYRNESSAIGYSFRWYATEMRRAPVIPGAPPRPENARKGTGLKLLAVNGIPPDPARIADNSYPFTVPFYAVVREGPLSKETTALIDWLTGPEGRALIARTGYVPLGG